MNNPFSAVLGATPPPQPNQAALPQQTNHNPFSAAFTQKPRGAASFLEKVSDVLDVPLAYGEAGIADIFKANRAEPSHLAQVTKDLREGGTHQVAQNDIYFRKGSLQRVLADPNASAQSKASAHFFMEHPWIAGAADFAGEFANPVNFVAAPITRGIGIGAKVLSLGARRVPFLGHAIEATSDYALSLVNKYHPLNKLTPVAEQVARQSDAAARTAVAANEALTQRIFGFAKQGLRGTTQDERVEIWRRAHGDPAKAVTGGTLSDGDINARAHLYRASLDGLDQEMLTRGLADQEDLMAGYFPMRAKVAYNSDVFDRSVAEVPRGTSGGVGAVRPRFRSLNTNEKVFRSPDEVLKANEEYGGELLKPTFDPADEFLAHVNKISGNFALDDFVKTLTKETPTVAHELVLGGLKGKPAMTQGIRLAGRQAVAEATSLAAKEIAQRFGITQAEVGRIADRNFANASAVRGRLSEAQRGAATVARLGGRVTGAVHDVAQQAQNRAEQRLEEQADVEIERQQAQQTPKAPILNSTDEDAAAAAREHNAAREAALQPGKIASVKAKASESARSANLIAPLTGRVGKIAADYHQKILERGTELADKLTDPERKIAQEYRTLRDDFAQKLQPKYRERALDAMTPRGYQRVKGVAGLSGLERMQYTAFKPEAVKYFVEHGAPAKEASGVAAFFDRLNALYRIGIVTNPIIHPFYNLLWAYLGSGANPARLTRMFRSAPTALDEEAERYGAHVHFGSKTALGGSYGQMLLGSFQEARGVAGKANWALSRLSNANKGLVFDRLERNMASELWDDLAKKRMKSGMEQEAAKRQAALDVRKAFGDYDNISAAERNMRYAFFFYPWTKTVIPFWLKAASQRPQMVTAPMRAIQTHNAIAGDPNIDKEKMGTMYLGTDNKGAPLYKTAPLPQRWLEDVGELAVPRKGGEADITAGIPERFSALGGAVQSHLVPAWSVGAQTVAQAMNPQAQEPGVTPASHVVYNIDAPLGTQAQQIASFAGSSALPFGGNIANMATAFREALNGRPEAIPQELLGGFEYLQRTPQQQKALGSFMRAFTMQYDRAMRLPAAQRSQIQTRAYALFRRKVDALLNPKPAPSGAPLQVPGQ